MTDWIDKEVEKLTKKGKKMSKIEFLRLIFIVAYSKGTEEFKEKAVNLIDKISFNANKVPVRVEGSKLLIVEELKKDLEEIK